MSILLFNQVSVTQITLYSFDKTEFLNLNLRPKLIKLLAFMSRMFRDPSHASGSPSVFFSNGIS